MLDYVRRTRRGRSRSQRVNELLQRAIRQERYETLEAEAAAFFSASRQAARAESSRAADALAREDEAARRMRQAEADLTRLRASLESAGKGGARAVADSLATKLLDAEGRVDKWRSAQEEATREAQAARRALLAAVEQGAR